MYHCVVYLFYYLYITTALYWFHLDLLMRQRTSFPLDFYMRQ